MKLGATDDPLVRRADCSQMSSDPVLLFLPTSCVRSSSWPRAGACLWPHVAIAAVSDMSYLDAPDQVVNEELCLLSRCTLVVPAETFTDPRCRGALGAQRYGLPGSSPELKERVRRAPAVSGSWLGGCMCRKVCSLGSCSDLTRASAIPSAHFSWISLLSFGHRLERTSTALKAQWLSIRCRRRSWRQKFVCSRL